MFSFNRKQLYTNHYHRCESLIVAAAEEQSQRLLVCSLPMAIDPGEVHLLGVGGLAVDLVVPDEVEGGVEPHHARVVHLVPVHPLPGGQVRQHPTLPIEADINSGLLLNVGRQVAETVTQSQTLLRWIRQELS